MDIIFILIPSKVWGDSFNSQYRELSGCKLRLRQLILWWCVYINLSFWGKGEELGSNQKLLQKSQQHSWEYWLSLRREYEKNSPTLRNQWSRFKCGPIRNGQKKGKMSDTSRSESGEDLYFQVNFLSLHPIVKSWFDQSIFHGESVWNKTE